MKPTARVRSVASVLILSWFAIAANTAFGGSPVEIWLTHPDGTARFERQPSTLEFRRSGNPVLATIDVNEQPSFQTMEGFGYTLTGGSAQHLMAMSAPARAALLNELFESDGTNIGVSYLRLTIGASDLNARVFTYNDLPPGTTDPELRHFDLGQDRQDVIPILKANSCPSTPAQTYGFALVRA